MIRAEVTTGRTLNGSEKPRRLSSPCVFVMAIQVEDCLAFFDEPECVADKAPERLDVDDNPCNYTQEPR